MSTLNPITVEVIGSSLMSIVEEMGEALVRASHSTNIKERRDCSTAIFDREGNTLCQAEHIPMHLGSFIGIIPHIMSCFSPEDIKPGDVFVGNDPYEGGATHLPDIVLAQPVFSNEIMVAWAVNTAHHSDFADRGHAHIFQEGLRIPPVRLYREGKLQPDIQRMILLNCQVPDERLSDLRAQMAANSLCVSRVIELCKKYGTDTVLSAGNELQNYAERKMRNGIKKIPDGKYYFNDIFCTNEWHEELDFSVEITIDNDEMILEFDAPPQVKAGLNMVYTSLLASTFYAVKSVVDPTILPNAGLSRPLTVNAPLGSILNCVHPAAVDGRISAAQRVCDVIMGALSKALPGRVSAAGNGCCTAAIFSGHREDGSMWVYLETIGGGGGARPDRDGLSGVHVHMTNTSNLPIEALEIEYPLTLLSYELVDDSAGIGKFRGGQGLRRTYRVEAPCRLTIQGGRVTSCPWGLNGGQEAKGTMLKSSKPINFNATSDLEPGQIITIETPGGGGYGNIYERSIEDLKRDFIESRISENIYEESHSKILNFKEH